MYLIVFTISTSMHLIGIQTGEDARFYGISTEFPDGAFSNEDKTIVIQFQVKHEQSIDCGGGYLKLWPSTLKQNEMHGDSPYNIMFGPDICGPSTKRVICIRIRIYKQLDMDSLFPRYM